MRQLSDEMLIDTYYAAVKHQLEPDFIMLLFAELKRRKVDSKQLDQWLVIA